MKPVKICRECGWELDSEMPPHEDMHTWWVYWSSLTEKERQYELRSMAAYSAMCHDCGADDRATCACRKEVRSN